MTDARKRTPLWEVHRQLGARLIDFGGWDMPVQYKAGTIKEHRAVRDALGLFDVSHMGEARLRGPRAKEAVARLTTNDVAGAAVGKAVYTLLCRPDGGIVDDCIFYKRADDHYYVIINAGNTAKDLAWMREQVGDLVEVQDESEATALIAVQGPKAVGVVDDLAGGGLAQSGSFTFGDRVIAGVACMVARTGYTGEDGFELACAAEDAVRLWNALYAAAEPHGGLPIGLGARDTLRLEARLPLYGNDLDDTTSPLEAGLGWAVKLDKHEFLGKAAIASQKAHGLERTLVGFRIDAEARAIPRHGYDVLDGPRGGGGKKIGVVTSGGPGISVPGSIGLAYVPVAHGKAGDGQQITIDCRGKDVAATIVKGKFYKRPGA